MELLKEFTEKNLGISRREVDFSLEYRVRQAARAVVIDKNGKLAILFDTRHNHHKIPGGGVNKNEAIKRALKREMIEEAGCSIKILNEIGLIIEYRNKINLLQLSYCWLAQVRGKTMEPRFDKREIANGFKLEWLAPNQAVKLFKKDKPRGYSGHFMWARDLLFLQKAKELIQ